MAVVTSNSVEGSTRRGASSSLHARAADAGVFLLYFAIVLCLQWTGGAYQAEIGRFSDDSAHYITGLMVRDYLAEMAPAPPMEFAKQYYLHYPRVALGHWPPSFYAVEGIWMLLFSPSAASLMVMMACTAALLAGVTYAAAGSLLGRLAGFAAGLLLVLTPLVQGLSSAVMLDLLTALLCVWAVRLFARYLENTNWRHSVAFGVIASLALLTHGAAVVLALVPPIAVALERRVRLVLRPDFWAPAFIVLAISGPWYWLAPGARHEYAVRNGGMSFLPKRVGISSVELLSVIGVVLVAFLLLGLIVRILGPLCKGRTPGAEWSCTAAVILSFATLRVFVHQSAGSRHLVVVLPALLLFAAAGVAQVAAWLRFGPVAPWKRAAAVAALAGAGFAAQVFTVPQQEPGVYSPIARSLLSRPEYRNSVFLIASNRYEREGQFIAAIAALEQRPGHYVLRASKAIVSVGMLGKGYRLRYRSPEELLGYLQSVPVGVLVLDGCGGTVATEHHVLLRKTLDLYAGLWKLEGSHACSETGADETGRIQVYSLLGHQQRGGPDVLLDMTNRLGETLVNRRP